MNFNLTFTPPTTGTSAHKADPDKTYPCFFFFFFFFVIETTDLTLSPEVPNLEFNCSKIHLSSFLLSILSAQTSGQLTLLTALSVVMCLQDSGRMRNNYSGLPKLPHFQR